MKIIQLISCLLLTCFVKGQEVKLMLPVGHTDGVKTAMFSPDGKKIVTASDDNTAKVWDAATGVLLEDLKGHTSYVKAASFSPDSRKIVTASVDKTAKIWDAATGVLLADLKGHTDWVSAASFSPDGKKIVTTSFDKTAKIWDAATGVLLADLKGHTSYVNAASFSPDGKKIVTASWDNTSKIWDADIGVLLANLKEHTNYVDAASFSPDGKKIVTVSRDNTAKIWDAANGLLLADLKGHTDYVNTASFSPDGKKIVTASRDHIAKIWDAATGVLLEDLKGHTTYVNTASFSPDGKKIVTVSEDKTAKIWDAATGVLLADLKGHTYWINAVSFSPDGKKIVTASSDNTAKIWDAATGAVLADLKGHTYWVFAASFSPDGKKIITASSDNTAKIWDAAIGVLLANLKGHTSFVNKASFSPDGKKIVTTSYDSTAKIWDASTGVLLADLKEHTSYINAASFSPDGKKIVTASSDNTAKIWDAATGVLIADLKGHIRVVYAASFSPDGKKIVTASWDNTAKIWDASTGVLLANLKGHTSNVVAASFSPDGKKIVTASWDKTAKIWDAATGVLLADLKEPSYVEAASFSPDGKKIVTTSSDNTAKIWDAATVQCIQTIPLGINCYLSDINFTTSRFTAINNNEVKIFNLTTGEHLLSCFAIDSTDWAVLHPSGLFDASPGAMEKMYWVKGDEIIDFNQLKDRYWQPGLWGKIMQGKPLRNVEGMNTLKLQPEIELGEFKNNILSILLKKREGGYGKVSILVNNKEVIADARPADFDITKQQQKIIVNLKNYLVAGLENEISVKTQTADGFVSSRGVSLKHKEPSKTATKKPAFYAIICGTGEFSNPGINLKYAVPDANAMAKAITVGANNLFGKDSTHVYLLSSPGNNPTNKKNIQQAFADVKKKAKPEDIVVVYLSGHGITYGGESGDFYYLTTEASGGSAESFADPVLRQAQTINTAEFTQWLNAIPALKQIMIIDACGSGKAVDNLIAKRDVDASQIKAIDRMKDRTGLYIISGCASDAVSYEATRYGQGLLTYSLLQAMKGAALKENVNVDVLTMLNYARDEVPKMANGIGGIQKPQLLIPKGGSFDIGIIKESDKPQIPLAQVKPVFVRTTLFEETKKRDILKLSQAINEKLNEVSSKGDAKSNIVFIDADDYPDACSISGGYTINGEKINFKGTLVCGSNEKPIKFDNLSKNELVQKLVDLANSTKD